MPPSPSMDDWPESDPEPQGEIGAESNPPDPIQAGWFETRNSEHGHWHVQHLDQWMSVRKLFLESLDAALLDRIVEDWLVVLSDNGLHVEQVVPVKSAIIGMPDERLEELSTPCTDSTLLALVPSTTSLYVKGRTSSRATKQSGNVFFLWTAHHQMSDDEVRNKGDSLVSDRDAFTSRALVCRHPWPVGRSS